MSGLKSKVHRRWVSHIFIRDQWSTPSRHHIHTVSTVDTDSAFFFMQDQLPTPAHFLRSTSFLSPTTGSAWVSTALASKGSFSPLYFSWSPQFRKPNSLPTWLDAYWTRESVKSKLSEISSAFDSILSWQSLHRVKLFLWLKAWRLSKGVGGKKSVFWHLKDTR